MRCTGMFFYIQCHIIVCCFLVINQEKTMQNIEGFDKSKLKHAETEEKVVMPERQGRSSPILLHA